MVPARQLVPCKLSAPSFLFLSFDEHRPRPRASESSAPRVRGREGESRFEHVASFVTCKVGFPPRFIQARLKAPIRKAKGVKERAIVGACKRSVVRCQSREDGDRSLGGGKEDGSGSDAASSIEATDSEPKKRRRSGMHARQAHPARNATPVSVDIWSAG